MTIGQRQCVMAWQLFAAMAYDIPVAVETSQGTVTGRVESNEHHRPRGRPPRPVEEINGARLAFWIAGQRVHLGTIASIQRAISGGMET